MKKRPLIESALVLVALVVIAWHEHRGTGVDMALVVTAALLAGPLLRRGLDLLNLAPGVSPVSIALELAALVALVPEPSSWGALPAALAALLAAFPGATTTERPSLLERASALLFALGAIAAVARGWNAVDRAAPWAVGPLAVLLLDLVATAPWARRGEPARQAAGLSLVAACGLIHAHWGFAAFEIECVTLLASWIVALALLIDALARLTARNDAQRLSALRRRIAFSTIACAVPLALLWGLGELAMARMPVSRELHGPPLVDDGHSFHVPGARYVFDGPVLANPQPRDIVRNEFVWNRDGYHDLDHDLAKPAGCVRVAVIGDSFVDAYQLRLEDTLHRQLARRLPNAETLAFGHAGWCQVQELAVLREKALAYKPDLVVLEFLPSNDVFENAPEATFSSAELEHATFGRFASGVARHRHLYFTGLVVERLDRALRWLSRKPQGDVMNELWRRDLPPEHAARWERAWERTESLVREIADTCDKAGSRLVVVVFANEPEVLCHVEPEKTPQGFDFPGPARRMEAICRARGIPCVSLAERLAKRSAEERAQLFLVGDGHWSSAGHHAAAEEVAKYLTSETTLWREVSARR